jgi:hypothetical protein
MNTYLDLRSEKCRHPIMTLPMLNGRTYIVSSPALAAHVQRASSTLDFEQMTIEFTPRMCGLSKETKQILEDPKHKEEGRERMVAHVMHNYVHPYLAAPKMGEIADIQLDHFSKFINAVPNGLETGLYKFLTREITAASMHTFYGPENPFALHPELIEEFWNWEAGIVGYLLGVFPKFTARAAWNGMNRCSAGFAEYLENGRQKQAYGLLRKRQAAHDNVGIPYSEQGRLEVAMSMAFNVNAGISIFWLMNDICSRPELLAEIREEIRANAYTAPGTISSTALRESCPLLNSVYKESMRLIGPMTSARYVLEDTIIADTYLLKKDNIVQIAGGVIHSDAEIWGPDANTFNPRRFYNSPSGIKTTSSSDPAPSSKSKQVHPAAYRVFGGGSSLCPGRHFAQLEICSLTACLIMGWDLKAPEGEGTNQVKWNPPKDEKKFPIAVVKPTKEVNVRMVRRQGMENTEWIMKF